MSNQIPNSGSSEHLQHQFSQLRNKYDLLLKVWQQWFWWCAALLAAGSAFLFAAYGNQIGVLEVGVSALIGFAVAKNLRYLTFSWFDLKWKCPSCNGQLPSLLTIDAEELLVCPHCQFALAEQG